MNACEPNVIRLHFDTEYGTFFIESDAEQPKMLELSLRQAKGDSRQLGHYYLINDAIKAVVQQQSGCPEWDALSPRELPFRVFDITCWNVEYPAKIA